MCKKDLIASVAKEASITQAAAAKAVDAILGSIAGALAAGEKVQISGFGTFEVKHRDARTGYNLRTRQKVEVPASNVPTFKPAKALKDKV